MKRVMLRRFERLVVVSSLVIPIHKRLHGLARLGMVTFSMIIQKEKVGKKLCMFWFFFLRGRGCLRLDA